MKEKLMNFVRANWSQLCIAVAAGTLAILYIIMAALLPSGTGFLGTCTALGPMFFFLGLMIYIFAKLADQTRPFAKYILLGTGALASLFLFLALFDTFRAGVHTYNAAIGAITSLVIMGIIPLIRGMAKVFPEFVSNVEKKLDKVYKINTDAPTATPKAPERPVAQEPTPTNPTAPTE